MQIPQQSSLIAAVGAQRGRSCGKLPGSHAAHIWLSKQASRPIAWRAGKPAVSNRLVRGRAHTIVIKRQPKMQCTKIVAKPCMHYARTTTHELIAHQCTTKYD